MKKYYLQFQNCLQKEVPFCQASCPFHLDIKDFMEKVNRGAFDAAYKTYRNAVTFPEIVAALCPQPCKNLCPLGDGIDRIGAIEIRGLERRILAEVKNNEPIFYNVPQKKQRAAIIGGGISGLACAIRLASKKYSVEIFEKTDRLGGHLWEISKGGPQVGGLTPEIFLNEFEQQMKQEDIIYNFNREIRDINQLIAQGYRAIYVATGEKGEDFNLLDQANQSTIIDGVACFAGGSLTARSTIEALAQGIRTATTIEIFFKTKKIDLLEDIRTSKTQIDSLKQTNKIGPPLDPYGKVPIDKIVEETDRCLKCQCDSCMISCDLVAFTEKWPLRIKDEVQATLLEGQADIKAQPAKRLINTCTHCGLCENICPAAIDMDNMFLKAKKDLHRQKKMPWAFHDFWLRDMDFADGIRASLIRKPRGILKSHHAFFPGCQLGASDPNYVIESYRWLLSKDPTVSIFLKCCATPAKWSGDEKRHQDALGKLKEDWQRLGKPKLIIACPSCINNFKEFLPEIDTISLYEYMSNVGGPVPAMKATDEKWSIFDPCATSKNKEIPRSVREIIKKDAKWEIEALAVQEGRPACCSYGGHVSTANPKFADFVIDRRISESKNPYITYCINCRDSFLGAGKKTIHILDILFGVDKSYGHAVLPTVSSRRKNRIRLRKNLLKEFWGEETMGEDTNNTVKITLSPELDGKLNKEHILLDEIAETIHFCERTGRKIKMVGKNTFSGYHKIGHMTYWVEYRPKGESYELINAYSHRMEIKLEAVWNGKKVDTHV